MLSFYCHFETYERILTRLVLLKERDQKLCEKLILFYFHVLELKQQLNNADYN